MIHVMPSEENRPRVLLLADSPYFGGITSHLISVFRAMRQSRFDILLATLPGRRDDNALADLCRREEIPLHEFSMNGRFSPSVMADLRAFVEANEIALVHTHNYRATLIARLARLAVPVINTCHGQIAERSLRLKAWQWAELRAMRRHPLTIACSDYVRRWLIRQGLDAGRVRTIHNGYEPAAAAVAPTRGEAGVPDDALLVFYAGRLCEGKGLDVLIEAAAGMAGVAVIVAGEGPLRPALERQAREANAPVRFLGHVAQPAPWYRLADVVALPSRMEALPMTLIEAAAYGRASVATRAGGIPEVVDEGESGLLVDYGDVAGLRAAIETMKSAEMRAGMGRRAHLIWEERFSPQRFADELSRAYRDVLEG